MCGIVGIVEREGVQADRETVRRMVACLRHRGPDDTGDLVDQNVAFGHARLSIVDLTGGHQPMCNRDGTLWITFNGEIFNYPELRQELLRRGHRFATSSDTEVILHQYEEKGEDCVHDFNGQWAFAIWDLRRRRLFLSRDRLGVRPLYFTQVGGTFIFASEIKALLAYPGVSAEPDIAALDQIFTFWFPVAPRTFFKNISQLPPGHSLVLENGAIRERRYWHLTFPAASADRPAGAGWKERSEGETGEQLLELLTDAARIRLRADVAVGTYLSGGLDSTLVTALARRCSSGPVASFSVSFDDAEFDEKPYQQEAARYLGVERYGVRCNHREIAGCFEDVVQHAEQPVLRTAPAPLYLLARLVRHTGYKVVLTGEGADEIFGGYDIYKEAKVRRFWARQPRSAWRPLLLRRLYPFLAGFQAMPQSYREAFFRISDADLGNPLFSHLLRWELTAKLKLLFSDEVRHLLAALHPVDDLIEGLPREFSSWDGFTQAQYLETAYFLPGYLLSAQGDRMTMAHGVEGRFPYLDHRLVDFASTLPARLKMKVLEEKYILKRAARDLVPPSVINRPKQSYRAPDGVSFFSGGRASEYVEDSLSAGEIARFGLFDVAAVAKLADKFRRGAALGMKDNMGLIGVLSTQILMRQFTTIKHAVLPSDTSEHMQEPKNERRIEAVYR